MNDKQIRELVFDQGMIDPYVTHKVSSKNGQGILSYGQSSFGYDITCARMFWVLNPNKFWDYKANKIKVLDPKSPPDVWDVIEADYVDIAPNHFVLAYSVEKLNIPPDCLAFFVSKSSYARVGTSQLCTPAEPSWQGHLTLEIANHGPIPARIYAGEGIAQMIVLRGELCEKTYGNGKYQNQGPEVVGVKI